MKYCIVWFSKHQDKVLRVETDDRLVADYIYDSFIDQPDVKWHKMYQDGGDGPSCGKVLSEHEYNG